MLFSYSSAVRECKRMNNGEKFNLYSIKKKWYGWIIVDAIKTEKVVWFKLSEKLPDNDRAIRLGVRNGTFNYVMNGLYKNEKWYALAGMRKLNKCSEEVILWRELIYSDSYCLEEE